MLERTISKVPDMSNQSARQIIFIYIPSCSLCSGYSKSVFKGYKIFCHHLLMSIVVRVDESAKMVQITKKTQICPPVSPYLREFSKTSRSVPRNADLKASYIQSCKLVKALVREAICKFEASIVSS